MAAPYARGDHGAIAGDRTLATTRVASFAAVRNLHARLAEAAGHPFARPAWVARHWSCLEADTELLLHVVERAGAPIALLPLVRRDDGTIRFAADRLSDVAGPICAPADLPDALGALRAFLDRRPAGDVFVGASLPAGATAHLPGARVTVEPSPLIAIGPPTWAEYLAGPAARRRRRIVRQAEALCARPDVAIRDARTPHDVVRDLDGLARLHATRFAARSRVFAPARLAFFRAALAELAADGLVSVRTLSLAGRDAAALLLFHPEHEDWFYQGGWDPTFAALSVGRALIADAVRRAFAEGRRAFRLLRGAEPYKDWWATSDAPVLTIERPTGGWPCA